MGPPDSASQEWEAQRSASAGEGQQGRSSWLTTMQVMSIAQEMGAGLQLWRGNGGEAGGCRPALQGAIARQKQPPPGLPMPHSVSPPTP